MTRCSAACEAEPMAGSAPRAHVWVLVEHPDGWGDAPLARSHAGVRVLMVRGPRAEPDQGGTAGTRVWVAHVGVDPTLRVGVVADPWVVAKWSLADLAAGSHRNWGQADPEPLLVVCANGRRDRCCGHSGGRLAAQLWRAPLGGRVLTGTHLGGHRFAPTALLLPHGALYGRLDEPSAVGILAGAVRGELPVQGLRGFSRLAEAAQVADAHVRAALGLTVPAALPVRMVPGADPDRITALVSVPGGSGAVDGPDRGPTTTTVRVSLVRREFDVMASCGREVAPMSRWAPFGPPEPA